MITVDPVTVGATGNGLVTLAADGSVLDAWYPEGAFALHTGGPPGDGDITGAASDIGPLLAAAERVDDVRAVRVVRTRTRIESLAAPPRSVADAYLRLHLLSARHVLPRSIDLTDIFAILPNNAWTSAGPVPAGELSTVRLRARAAGLPLEVHGVDQFPRMTDYVLPSGVRIADANRVRLGAHLAAGTVVMQEGFCNYNAGTLGPSMVEGRISQGVIVGTGSDIGGGASIMGRLSGGGTMQVTIGERCLIGANAGIGISLGDGCVIEAGLYLTAGTKVVVLADDGRTVVQARHLAGVPGLLFRRHSLSGEVQAVPQTGRWQGLNPALHAAG